MVLDAPSTAVLFSAVPRASVPDEDSVGLADFTCCPGRSAHARVRLLFFFGSSDVAAVSSPSRGGSFGADTNRTPDTRPSAAGAPPAVSWFGLALLGGGNATGGVFSDGANPALTTARKSDPSGPKVAERGTASTRGGRAARTVRVPLFSSRTTLLPPPSHSTTGQDPRSSVLTRGIFFVEDDFDLEDLVACCSRDTASSSFHIPRDCGGIKDKLETPGAATLCLLTASFSTSIFVVDDSSPCSLTSRSPTSRASQRMLPVPSTPVVVVAPFVGTIPASSTQPACSRKSDRPIVNAPPPSSQRQRRFNPGCEKSK